MTDDFSESSEVSTYLEGVSSEDTSHSLLTSADLTPSSAPPPPHGPHHHPPPHPAPIPCVVVTSATQDSMATAASSSSLRHQRLAATFSAPPTFPHPHYRQPPDQNQQQGMS